MGAESLVDADARTARVKIGYQAAIMLLRAGAEVIALTRFPKDAVARYAREPDFNDWGHCLQVYGIDLRHTPSVEAPAAAQRLLAHHGELRRQSRALAPAAQYPGVQRVQDSARLSQLPLLDGEGARRRQPLFPAGQLDADLQQVDLRAHNSWRLPLAEVSATELLEVQLVNAVAPFILTNMAKAALNMMTRTSAADYVADGIHMNSVDTGWITDEDPAELAERKRLAHNFHPPLDYMDAAARICDPIFSGFLTGRHVWGQFLKDYRPARW